MRKEFVFVLMHPTKGVRTYGSIAAIYGDFTAEEIGLPKYKVWGSVEIDKPLVTDKVTIYKTIVSRRRQKL